MASIIAETQRSKMRFHEFVLSLHSFIAGIETRGIYGFVHLDRNGVREIKLMAQCFA